MNFPISKPTNEPVRNYAPGDSERTLLQNKLNQMAAQKIEIPCIIGERKFEPAIRSRFECPTRIARFSLKFHRAGPKEIQQAAEAALRAKRDWET